MGFRNSQCVISSALTFGNHAGKAVLLCHSARGSDEIICPGEQFISQLLDSLVKYRLTDITDTPYDS